MGDITSEHVHFHDDQINRIPASNCPDVVADDGCFFPVDNKCVTHPYPREWYAFVCLSNPQNPTDLKIGFGHEMPLGRAKRLKDKNELENMVSHLWYRSSSDIERCWPSSSLPDS